MNRLLISPFYLIDANLVDGLFELLGAFYSLLLVLLLLHTIILFLLLLLMILLFALFTLLLRLIIFLCELGE